MPSHLGGKQSTPVCESVLFIRDVKKVMKRLYDATLRGTLQKTLQWMCNIANVNPWFHCCPT